MPLGYIGAARVMGAGQFVMDTGGLFVGRVGVALASSVTGVATEVVRPKRSWEAGGLRSSAPPTHHLPRTTSRQIQLQNLLQDAKM